MDFDVKYYKKQIKFRDEILKATKRLEELNDSLAKLKIKIHFIENGIKENENKIKEYLAEIDKYKRVLSNILIFRDLLSLFIL
jgi:predicted  nucleic acid-binding Zn-ribbon protein